AEGAVAAVLEELHGLRPGDEQVDVAAVVEVRGYDGQAGGSHGGKAGRGRDVLEVRGPVVLEQPMRGSSAPGQYEIEVAVVVGVDERARGGRAGTGQTGSGGHIREAGAVVVPQARTRRAQDHEVRPRV